jgi:hypothetical protein
VLKRGVTKINLAKIKETVTGLKVVLRAIVHINKEEPEVENQTKRSLRDISEIWMF